MSTPHRIQLRRTKGWRMPPNTVKVTRPGLFGNPFKVGQHGKDKLEVVGMYRQWLMNFPEGKAVAEAARRTLRGKNLACFCGEGPCHADVLLEIANSEEVNHGNQ